MSYQYRSVVEGREELPVRHAVRVASETLIFKTAAQATAAYNAISKAMGREGYISFTFRTWGSRDETFTDSERGVDPEVKLQLTTEHIGDQQELAQFVRWQKVVKCDGTGLCSCWNREDDHEVPEGWQEYVHEGKVKHMCPKCQSKETSFAPPQPSC